MKSHSFIFLFFLVILPFLAVSQNTTVISGTVVENSSQEPLGFATVMLKDQETNDPISGVTTDMNGQFSMEVSVTNYYLELSFIGFRNQIITDLPVINNKVELGIIYLEANTDQLDEVVVRSERSQTEFKLDKRVFNVGQDLSSTGASALEVLNNVPSVNVNIEGEISLRGSAGVQVLINGKPSVLANEQGNALGTITADMIEKIEVITNPSAKYDAEGTSGIINIVIKKEERKGINGSASFNVGIPHNHSFGLSLNRRTEKFNLFSQLGVGYRELPNDIDNINTDLASGVSIITDGNEFRNETFYNVVLGTDYHINKNNVLTLSGNYAYEVEDQPSLTNFISQDAAGTIDRAWSRTEVTEATNPKLQYELQYKSQLKGHKDHILLFSALGNFFGKEQASEFTNEASLGSIEFKDQEIETQFQEGKYTFNLDYVKPFSDKFTIETGAQYVLNNVSNDFEVRDDIDGEWIVDTLQTNVFLFDQNVLGLYGTAAYEAAKWGIKGGMRVENTVLNTLLVTTNVPNNRDFTNWFPSLHTSYKVTEAFSLQAGYSKRIFRPRLWDLNPFFNIRNNFSIRTGNPNLLPEFTDSYEVSSIYIAEKTSSNMSIYYRNTTNVVERISVFENNVNTTKPLNIGTNQATGIEFNTKYTHSKTLSFNADLNYNFFVRKGELNDVIFDFNADQWTTKIRSKIKLPSDIDFELTGQYESRLQTIQNSFSPVYFADMGLRKKILDGRGVINFSIRDIFASRVRESEIDQSNFYIYSRRQRGRFITAGFSYGFGKGEAMEFSGQRRR